MLVQHGEDCILYLPTTISLNPQSTKRKWKNTMKRRKRVFNLSSERKKKEKKRPKLHR